MTETETEEVHIEGQELYLNFFHERVRNEGLAVDDLIQNFNDPVSSQAEREFQALAEEFSRSPERTLVFEQAEQVDVSSLDKEKFWALLKGDTKIPIYAQCTPIHTKFSKLELQTN